MTGPSTPSPSHPPVIALAAGGTGGHMFPAEAVAAELARLGCRLLLLTDARGARHAERWSGVEVHTLPSASPAGDLLARTRAALVIGRGALAALPLMRRAGLLVAFGGYPAVPPALAARLLGRPVVLHEQNAVLGRANRLIAGWARHLALSVAETRAVPQRLPGGRSVTGNPVRAAIAAIGDRPWRAPPPDGPFSLLVTGGSQGAAAFARLLPEALALLPAALRGRLRLVQQARPEDLEPLGAALARLAVTAELAPFFADMPARLEAADLAITRAGASTIAELAAAGRPAILLPYPHAADDHQTANAAALVHAGAAELVPEGPEAPARLAAFIALAAATPQRLAAMAANARAAARPGAAAALARLALDTLPSPPEPAR